MTRISCCITLRTSKITLSITPFLSLKLHVGTMGLVKFAGMDREGLEDRALRIKYNGSQNRLDKMNTLFGIFGAGTPHPHTPHPLCHSRHHGIDVWTRSLFHCYWVFIRHTGSCDGPCPYHRSQDRCWEDRSRTQILVVNEHIGLNIILCGTVSLDNACSNNRDVRFYRLRKRAVQCLNL